MDLKKAVEFDFVADDLENKELHEVIGYEPTYKCNTVIGYVVTTKDGTPIETFEENEIDEAFKFLYQ